MLVKRMLLLCALKQESSTYAMTLTACITPGRHCKPGFTWTAPTTGRLLSRGVRMMCMRPLNTRLRTAICTSSHGLRAPEPAYPAERECFAQAAYSNMVQSRAGAAGHSRWHHAEYVRIGLCRRIGVG